ncbi:MAG: AgmX/PglI C-terminal domain-containing protein [Deltaproteobacteria bacterium]|nr:AgmX/PglI C-terminal domain-containing protein [Deltaproteobacteria bacterium]
MSAANEEQVSKRDSRAPGQLGKVLRIGIIQGGKIIEERRLKKRETVSVGSGPKATFQISSGAVPKHFDLFEFTGTQHFLRFADGMEGKIQLTGDSVSDFKQISGRGQAVKRGNVMGVELNDESRGKVMIGDVTVLFQFVDPPSAPTKAVLPSDIKGSLISSIDVQFSSIFLATSIFMLILITYAQSQPYIEPTTIEEVSERYQKLIMPDRLPEPPMEQVADKGEEKAKEKTPDKGKDKPEKVSKAKGKAEKKAVDPEAAARARKEALAKAVAGKGLLGVIGTKGRGDGALSDVFADGDFGEGALGDAFSGIQGVDIADGSGARGTRGGGAGEGIGIGDMATSGGGSVSTGSKVEREVRAEARFEAPEVEGDLSPDVIKDVMRKNLRAMRDCYERQLKRFPNLQGKITITFEIVDSGKVSNVDITEDTVRNPEVKACIISRAKFWRFPKPSGGSVFVSTPLVFTPANS